MLHSNWYLKKTLVNKQRYHSWTSLIIVILHMLSSLSKTADGAVENAGYHDDGGQEENRKAEPLFTVSKSKKRVFGECLE